MTEIHTDAAVVGAGPGGYVAAIRLAQFGKETVIVTDGPLGGICLNHGCIPSKALIHGANAYYNCSSNSKYPSLGIGIDQSTLQIDYGALTAHKDKVVKILTRGVAQLLKANGVTVINGHAKVIEQGRLLVTNKDTMTIFADDIILATGSRPIELPAFRFDEDRILSSTGALALNELPEHLLVIGGGYIGLELGTYFAKLGAKVTIVELLDQILPGFDPEIVRIMARTLRRLGVTVHTKSKAVRYDQLENGLSIEIDVEGERSHIEASHVLVTVGRRPNSNDIGLETVKITPDPRGFIPVDHTMQTCAPHIYAIGDVAGEPMLAHKASYEANCAAKAIAGETIASELGIQERSVPGVVFTDPEIATVGLTEAEAEKQGTAVIVGRFPYAALGRAVTYGERDGFIKVLAKADDHTIVGCQIIGADASTMIAEAVLAIELKATAEDLERVIHAHPTLPEGFYEAVEDVAGKAVHIAPKRKR